MEKKLLTSLAFGAMVIGLTGVVSATTISYDALHDGNQKTSVYSNYAGFLTETFDLSAGVGGFTQSWSLTTTEGAGDIVNGSLSGQYAAPFGLTEADQTNYLTVPAPYPAASSGSVTFTLGNTYDYFGLWWGSVDTYNSIDFLYDGVVTETWTGPQAIAPSVANGNQTAPATNLYVNFMDLTHFNAFRLTSTNRAFEVDNITVGNTPVPEPATMLLFGTGLVGLAGARARRKKK